MLRTIYSRLKAFQEVVALLIFYVGWGVNPFHPDLLVTYTETPYFVPQAQHAANQTDRADLQLITVVLANKSTSTVGGIELQVHGLRRVLDSGARSSSNRFDPELARIAKPQKDPSTFYFDGVKEIPPGHNIQIQLVAETYRLIPSRITITSDAKQTRVYATSQTSGIFVFLEEHVEFLTALAFIAAILMGVKRLARPTSHDKVVAVGAP